MEEPSQLESLNDTFLCWRYLGIWPENNSNRYYKLCSYLFMFITIFIYDTLLVINLFYMPHKIEILIEEVTFFFNVVAITSKVMMIIIKKQKIYAVLDILECEEFQHKDNASRNMLKTDIAYYKMYWKTIFCVGNFAYIFKCIVPVVANALLGSYKIKLPTSNYYFLSDEFKNDYFKFIFFYQSFGIYGLMTYDISIDTFINGFLSFAITQMRMLNYKFSTFKSIRNSKLQHAIEWNNMWKLKQWLRHYDYILKYCNGIQDIFNVTLFIQYTMSSLIICFVSCGLLLPLPKEQYAFVFAYLFGMVLQIFAPAWLGTLITNQSQELMFAAYNSDWIARTESFKRSIKIFMVRTNTSIVIDGMKVFSLSLETFTSIMKTAYSFLTLVRNIQDESNVK